MLFIERKKLKAKKTTKRQETKLTTKKEEKAGEKERETKQRDYIVKPLAEKGFKNPTWLISAMVV